MLRLNKRISTAFLAGLACAALPLSTARAGVVVSVSGPSAATYPVGKKIADNARITLRAGDVVTVLNGGNTRVLRGAGTFSLGAKKRSASRGAFSSLTRQRSAQRVRTGAVREVPGAGAITRPNLWYVDVRQSGTHCLANDKNVRLWRKTNQGAAAYNLSIDGRSVPVSFDDGDMIVPWDLAAMPLSSGANYMIGAEGEEPSVTVNFVVLDKAARNPEALAEQLIENGCMKQLELLTSVTLVDEG